MCVCFDDFFFLFDLGFMSLSRIFHLYRADRSSKVGENRSTRGEFGLIKLLSVVHQSLGESVGEESLAAMVS